MLAAHVFKAFQGDVEIFCFGTLAAKTQLTDALATTVLPWTVNHHLDVSFHTCGFHIQQQTGCVALDSIEIEVLIAHDGTVGVVHHWITVPLMS